MEVSLATSGDALVPRSDFPMIERRVGGRRVVYLDSAATTLKPQCVIDAVVEFYRSGTANIHRGVHTLSQEASESFEGARDRLADFIKATSREIVFTANATDSAFIVASGLGLGPESNVVGCRQDHHSNIAPWMKYGEVRLVEEDPSGRVDLQRLEDAIDDRTKLVAVSQVSNVTGVIQPVQEVIEIAHRRGALVFVDAAQSAPHLELDVEAMGCDFLAFSGHKMLGPSGVGVLFVREDVWDRLEVQKVGGGTVDEVRRNDFSLKRFPNRFEAGTPNIEGVLGLSAAVEYLQAIGMPALARHDAHLARLMRERMASVRGIRSFTPSADGIAIYSFAPTSPFITSEVLGTMLSDSYKVMARTGTHCAHPYFGAHSADGAVRLSSYLYTSEEEIHFAIDAVEEILRRLGGH